MQPVHTQPKINNAVPLDRTSVNLLDHYTISAEDLAAFMVEDQQRRGERGRDRRQRKLERERMKGCRP